MFAWADLSVVETKQHSNDSLPSGFLVNLFQALATNKSRVLSLPPLLSGFGEPRVCQANISLNSYQCSFTFKVVFSDVTVVLAELTQVLAYKPEVQPNEPELLAKLAGLQREVARLQPEVPW